MSVKKIIITSFLYLAAMGAGPCKIMKLEVDDAKESTTDSVTDSDTDTPSCDTESCEHSLDVHVLIAGANSFATGEYFFNVTAPDKSVYSITCNLVYLADGFECESGDTDLLNVQFGASYKDMLFHIKGAPPFFDLSIEYNGYNIYKDRLTPKYDHFYPNGTDCEPDCFDGESNIAVTLI
jgi:hypothetical protein